MPLYLLSFFRQSRIINTSKCICTQYFYLPPEKFLEYLQIDLYLTAAFDKSDAFNYVTLGQSTDKEVQCFHVVTVCHCDGV